MMTGVQNLQALNQQVQHMTIGTLLVSCHGNLYIFFPPLSDLGPNVPQPGVPQYGPSTAPPPPRMDPEHMPNPVSHSLRVASLGGGRGVCLILEARGVSDIRSKGRV